MKRRDNQPDLKNPRLRRVDFAGFNRFRSRIRQREHMTRGWLVLVLHDRMMGCQVLATVLCTCVSHQDEGQHMCQSQGWKTALSRARPACNRGQPRSFGLSSGPAAHSCFSHTNNAGPKQRNNPIGNENMLKNLSINSPHNLPRPS